MTSGVEQLEFQAEARQLLDLMVHSVYSDKDSFLRELISNASDALDKLRIEAFRNKDLDVDTSDLHIEVDVDKDARTLTIRDNGIGIKPEFKEQIFGLFSRLHNDDRYAGTGIGLAICQRIVERYHGRIWVDSEPGRGSAFRFVLPA